MWFCAFCSSLFEPVNWSYGDEMHSRPLRLTTRSMLLQVAVLVFVLLVGFVLQMLVLRAQTEQQVELRALTVARTVALDPQVVSAVQAGTPTAAGVAEQRAEAVRKATHSLYVVVTDRRGIRFSHPNPRLIGQLVSTDPSVALSGHEVVAVEKGTLGLSARGKVPLRDPSGAVIGEVSVGIGMNEVGALVREQLSLDGLLLLAALILGVLATAFLATRLRRSTLGLETAEMEDLIREQVAVLEGVGEGVLAVDTAGRVTVCNSEAVRLLGVQVRPGVALSEVDLPAEVRALITAPEAPSKALRVIGDRVVLATRLAVNRAGNDLGMVLTLQDQSDLDKIGRDLEATRALTDALRAQGHEYTNRLHTLGGLLQMGHVDEAAGYIAELHAATLPANNLRDPYLQGLVAAKSAVAAERGVQLILDAESWVPSRLRWPLDAVTVVGNLVDNATRAAQTGRRTPAQVAILLLSEDRDLHVQVTDSGDGIASDQVERIFDAGFTTRRSHPERHGIGLKLARQTARHRGGDVCLSDRGGPAGGASHGAVFTAKLPAVLEAVGKLRWTQPQPLTQPEPQPEPIAQPSQEPA